jgi:TonB family protein
MSASALLALKTASRRNHVRHMIKVPLDVVVLRSGVPQNLPGRCIDLSEGGVGAVVAGELKPGQYVGVEMRLPNVAPLLQTRARVRHEGALRCGLQFVGLPAELRGMISYWKQTAEPAKTDRVPKAEAPNTEAPETPLSEPPRKRSSWFRSRVAVLALIGLLALAAIGLWRWQLAWNEIEQNSAVQTAPLRVASEIMTSRVLTRVEPIYPEEARREGKQGTIWIDTVIAADGTVKRAQAISGDELLAQAAADAVRQWRFEPYRATGRALEVETAIAIQFRLN